MYQIVFGIITFLLASCWITCFECTAQGGSEDVRKITKTTDFRVNGQGDHPNWSKSSWLTIPQRRVTDEDRRTQLKILYSGRGLYFLFACEDRVLTSTLNEDFLDLWTEDVVEVFLWPDQAFPVTLNTKSVQ